MDFQLALKTLDYLALSMVETCAATISWCHGPSLLLNRACTFTLHNPSHSLLSASLIPSLLHPLLWHPDAAQKGMLAYCQRLQRSESAEFMLEFKPFFSQQENPLLNKTLLGITEFECCWGRGSDGVDMEVSEHQGGGAAEAFARAALGSKRPSSSALLGSLLFLLSSVPMTVPDPPNSLYPILPPKA